MIKIIALLILVLFLSGCATTGKFSDSSLDTSKDEMEKEIINPEENPNGKHEQEMREYTKNKTGYNTFGDLQGFTVDGVSFNQFYSNPFSEALLPPIDTSKEKPANTYINVDTSIYVNDTKPEKDAKPQDKVKIKHKFVSEDDDASYQSIPPCSAMFNFSTQIREGIVKLPSKEQRTESKIEKQPK